MTFKHINFEDSTTMRSLFKVAKEKGWIKEEPLKEKIASSSQVDLNPSQSLLENLVKLCSGLRLSGFDKQADELENNFVQFKKANSLYNVGNETGEDLVHAAHPKGSHKMEDIDSKEATFEDILDKHLQMLNVVNKKPTGKFANSKDILKSVKTVLAQGASKEQLDNAIQNAMTAIVNNISKIEMLTSDELTFSIKDYTSIIEKLTSSPTIDNLRKVQDLLDKLESRLDPNGWVHYATFGASGLSEDTWQGIQSILNQTKKLISNAISWRSQLKQLESNNFDFSKQENVPKQSPTVLKEQNISASPIVSRLLALSNKLKAYSAVGNIAKNNSAASWIKQEISEISEIISRFNNIPEGAEEIVSNSFEKEVAEKESEVSQFAKTWLGQ